MFRRSYCSITVANHDGTWLIRFVSKNYTHLWKDFANKLCLVLYACVRLFFNFTWTLAWCLCSVCFCGTHRIQAKPSCRQQKRPSREKIITRPHEETMRWGGHRISLWRGIIDTVYGYRRLGLALQHLTFLTENHQRTAQRKRLRGCLVSEKV